LNAAAVRQTLNLVLKHEEDLARRIAASSSSPLRLTCSYFIDAETLRSAGVSAPPRLCG
jgi:hypothetical protein